MSKRFAKVLLADLSEAVEACKPALDVSLSGLHPGVLYVLDCCVVLLNKQWELDSTDWDKLSGVDRGQAICSLADANMALEGSLARMNFGLTLEALLDHETPSEIVEVLRCACAYVKALGAS